MFSGEGRIEVRISGAKVNYFAVFFIRHISFGGEVLLDIEIEAD